MHVGLTCPFLQCTIQCQMWHSQHILPVHHLQMELATISTLVTNTMAVVATSVRVIEANSGG